jgi:hypothetical protein
MVAASETGGISAMRGKECHAHLRFPNGCCEPTARVTLTRTSFRGDTVPDSYRGITGNAAPFNLSRMQSEKAIHAEGFNFTACGQEVKTTGEAFKHPRARSRLMHHS